MDKNFKLALSSSVYPFGDELFESFASNGIEAIEVSRSAKDYENLDYAALRELADRHGVELWSFHLPFDPFSKLDISHPDIAEGAIVLMKEYIDKATAIGIKRFVIHPSGEPIEEADRPRRMERSKKSLNELAEYAYERGAVIAVEDLPRTCLGRNSSDILELISANDKLRVCFDTNHLLNEDIGEFIKRVGDKIVTTHFSDYDFINERHWLPGEGQIDWVALVSGLEEVGYKGCILYELGFGAPWSIDRPRDLTCADFNRNFQELTEKKPLTVIGTPKAKLGMWKVEE